MMVELERRTLIVHGAPLPEHNTIGEAAQTESRDQDETGGPADVASESSGEYYQNVPEVNYSTAAKKNMAAMGLYGIHPMDHPLLKDFATFLKETKKFENFIQDVRNVSRFLFYANPEEASLQFVNNRELLRLFIRRLTGAQLKAQSRLNYLKSLKLFLDFHTHYSDLAKENAVLYEQCVNFIDFLKSEKKAMSKGVSKELVQKRHSLLTSGDRMLQPQDCTAVLRVAKADFLAIMNKLAKNSSAILQSPECVFVVYYLEGVIILKHLQRPGVVSHMTVVEWLSKRELDGFFVIGIKEHKTAATQVASIGLSQEEVHWFDFYYKLVRPQLLMASRKRKRDDVEADDKFFVSSTGKMINNPTNDLTRLHAKYNLPNVSSQMARRACEMAAKSMTESEKSLLASYLTHSDATAEKHYRMERVEDIVKASRILGKLQDQGQSRAVPSGQDAGLEDPEEGPSRAHADAVTPEAPVTPVKEAVICLPRIQLDNDKVKLQEALRELIDKHPITLSGAGPSPRSRKNVSKDFHKRLAIRWKKQQLKLRVEHTPHFSRRLPSKDRLNAWVKRQGWKGMDDIVEEVLQNWAPSGSEERLQDSKQIQDLCQTQKWRGLHVKEFEGKGRGVVTTRRFQAGEVVCDYHGTVVRAKEGKRIHQTTSESETGYMFFFQNAKGEGFCIDAHSEHCICHPGMQTLGRLINHSKKRANIKPRHCTYKIDGKEKDHVLFIATRALEVDEEVKFDYGVSKKSFGGEGEQLNWLNNA
ncbi:unnamed protein product [Knipowitschia caucasica]